MSGVCGRWNEGVSNLKMQGHSKIEALGKRDEILGTLDITSAIESIKQGIVKGRLGNGYVFKLYNDGTLRIDNENCPAFWAEIHPSVYNFN